jgi:cell division protein FtsQ
MARAAAAASPPLSQWGLGNIRWGRFTFWLVVGGVFMLCTLMAWRRVEEFLIKDDRFRIPEAEEFAGQSPNLVVEGVHYASPSQIRHVFAEDFGLSLYLCPIQKRRQQLLEIDWVEEAAVSKIWPNTLKVQVHERTPVLFVHLPPNRKGGMSQLALIDRDGYVLRPRVASRFTLPVITGVRETDPLETRRARVRRVLGLFQQIGPVAGKVSEVDASDLDNLVVAQRVDDGVVNVMLGDENYSRRLDNFIGSYSAIRAKRPNARTFDLRVDGVITAVGGDVRGQQ